MRELGLPPGYMVEVAPPPDAAAAAGTAGEEQSTAAGGATANGSPGGAAAVGGSEATAPAGQQAAGNGTVAAGNAASEELLDDFIPLGGGSSTSSDAEEDGDAAPAQLECCVQIPGLNAPLPEGADEQAWAPRQQQQQQQAAAPLMPPGFATPGSVGRTPSADARQHPLGSADRSRSAGGWAPLRGLHPPHQAASDGSGLAAAGQGRQHSAPTPPRPLHHGSSAPALYGSHQQTPPLPPGEPPARRPMPSYEPPPPLPGTQPAATSGGQMLPPGFGGAAQQAYSHHHHHQQQQHGHALPREDVYSVSRADPGHMLVFDQRGAAPAAAAAPQQFSGAAGAPSWGAPYGHALPQYGGHQLGGQGGRFSGEWTQQAGGGQWAAQQAGGGQWVQQPQAGGIDEPPAPPPDPQAAAAYQQRLWQSSGRRF